MSKQSFRERLTADFNSHVVVGNDPSVFRELADPAINLAVWENALPEGLWYQICMNNAGLSDIPFFIKLRQCFYETTQNFPIPCRTLPFSEFREECLERKSNEKDELINHFHSDSLSYRMIVNLNPVTDIHGDDGSIRILPNNRHQTGMRVTPYEMGAPYSIPLGVGNIGFFKGLQVDSVHPLYHAKPSFKIKRGTKRIRKLYVLST